MKLLAALSLLLAANAAPAADFTVLQRYSGIMEVRDFEQYITNDDTPMRRRTIDMKTIEAELDIKINPVSKFELEVEIEHGGAGTAMEYEQDEFGEFESEIEKGGEVVLEEAYYLRRLTPGTDVIVGKHPLWISFGSIMRKPLMYAPTSASELEARMIPTSWAEPGVQLHQRSGDFTMRLGLVAGLNSEFFRTYSWVGGGYQRQFEDINFDDPAYIASIEWGDVAHGRGLGVGYYLGGSQKHRRKRNRLTREADVQLVSFMAGWRVWRVGLAGQMIMGELENSDEVSKRNQTLPGMASPGTFYPVGARALLQHVQLDYEFIDGTTAYGRWGYVNTFQGVAGNIFRDPRYEVRQMGWGVSHQWDDVCALKLEWFREWTKLPGMPDVTTYALQFAFDTGYF